MRHDAEQPAGSLDERALAEALCEIGRRCCQKGYVASNDGNFSFRLAEDRVLCTPTMIPKGQMKPEDMVVVDLEGNQVAGTRRLTSEIRLHLYIYRHRPDVYAVVHTHAVNATAFAAMGRTLPEGVLPEAEVNLGPVPLAPYARTGTQRFAESLAPFVRDHDVFLLSNHGAVVVGQDPYDAYYRMESLDQVCAVLLKAMMAGGVKPLPPEAMEEIFALKEQYGIRDARRPQANAAKALAGIDQFLPHPGPITDAPKLGIPTWLRKGGGSPS